MFLCLLGLTSALWSDFPLLALKRAVFQILFCITVMLSFYYALKHNSLENTLFYSGVLIFLLIIISVLTGAGFNRSFTLTGFSAGKNVLGQNLLVYIVLICLFLKVNNKSSNKLMILGFSLLLVLFLTTSKTRILLFFIFLSVGYLIPKFSTPLALISFSMFFTVFIVIPCVSFYLGDIVHLGQYISLDALTGRGIIWNTLYTDISFYEKIDFGYGYATYFNTGVTPPLFDDSWSFLSRINSTHNGYIDLLMQFGFYGCLIILVTLCFLFKNLKHPWLAAALLVAMVYNFTESAFFRDYSMMWFMVLVVFSYTSTNLNRGSNA
jgi:O-antigen ligase